MTPGDFVLDLLSHVPKSGKTIVLLRHSKRDSFKGIPDSLREGVEITPDGVLMARAFGESLQKIFPGKRILLGHTIANRCRMTAESIGHGCSCGGDVRILGYLPEVESVVMDPENYVKLREEHTWQGLMQRWLDLEVPEETLQNPHAYCDTLLEQLVSLPGVKDDDLLVVIAHDVTLFPIIFSVFGKAVTSLEFLNGIVITNKAAPYEIRFKDADHALKAEWGGGRTIGIR
jgi:broad specificity phosphatase PhoE